MKKIQAGMLASALAVAAGTSVALAGGAQAETGAHVTMDGTIKVRDSRTGEECEWSGDEVRGEADAVYRAPYDWEWQRDCHNLSVAFYAETYLSYPDSPVRTNVTYLIQDRTHDQKTWSTRDTVTFEGTGPVNGDRHQFDGDRERPFSGTFLFNWTVS